ncbi:MAG TPA: efflux transporter outer membrane subunit, partial [Rhizomicrobium sp.]|nr:efflux transporter outer membrane subunit [Rhizomicrobium sp.]
MRWLALVLLGGLAACTVGPNYSRPTTPMPANYSALPKSNADAPLSMPVVQSVDLSAWWKGFHDAELESLIQRALSANLDLLTAASRVQEAREQEIVVGAAGLPQLNASGNAVRLHSGSNLLQKIGGSSGSSSGSSGPGASSGGTDLKLYSLGFDATWEADIFGGVRRSVEAARAGTEAARWEMRDGEVSLTAEIAVDYFTLRSGQARLAILAAQEKSQAETLDLVTARAHAGFVTELDVNQQRQLLASTQAGRPPLVAETVGMRHALAVLLGKQPGALDAELKQEAPLPVVPPSLPVGLPSDLLRARPDIRAAERRLAQATANIGVAVADLYPKFDLIASLAFSGPRLSDLLSGNNLGEAGLGSIMAPIFHGGQIHANIGAKQEKQKQAYFAYQKAILSAVQNAEDALTRYDNEQQRFKALNSAVQTATASTALALQQYRAGLVTYTSVLQTQSTRLTAEDDLAQSRAALITDLVSLYKAL